MSLSRRQFFALASTSAAGAVLLSPLQAFYAKKAFAAGPYGPLQADPNGVLDLPAGFTYRRLSETGQTMNDGYKVPGGHDGMAAFSGSTQLLPLALERQAPKSTIPKVKVAALK
jgi:hypothetical protein